MQLIGIEVGEPEILSKKELAELEEQAENNDAGACFQLWRYYSFGPDRRMNKARKMLEKAAALDDPTSLLIIAVEHLGSGNPRAMQKAVGYMRRAADLGEPSAQLNMGDICREGICCETNEQEALEWYRKAAAQEFEPAMLSLALHYRQKLLKEGDKSAAEPMLKWFRQAAQSGMSVAQGLFAMLLMEGEGVPPDPEEAFHWCSKAAEQGELPSIHNLALFYANGDFVQKDPAKAISYFHMAAERGYARSQYNLGICYVNGEGVEQDTETGMRWLTKAAKQDDILAVKALSHIYAGHIDNLKHLKDPEQEYKWVLRSGALGDADYEHVVDVAAKKLAQALDIDYDDDDDFY